MGVTDVIHQHTKRPRYTDEHGVNRPEYEQYYPVVFDIETTAETPQRPIIVTVYDSLDKEVHIAYLRGYQGFKPEDSEVRERAEAVFGELADSITVHRTVTQAWFENWVLNRVDSHPNKALCGHNVFFDLGILASPDTGAFDVFGIDPTEWDGAMTYKDLTCVFKRAGAFGRLYSWRPRRDIPVIDTQVVAKALWHPSGLSNLAESFNIGGVDVQNEEHGNLTLEYLEYNCDDIRQTFRVYEHLLNELQSNFNTDMTADKVFSTASIAKDVLKRMNYDRTEYTEQAAGIIAPSYFGGNTEALNCGELVDNVTYMDILSQYPTVAGLTDVWRVMRADTVGITEVPTESLPEPTVADVTDSDTWPELAPYYVAVQSDGATLPIRTKMDGTDTTRVYNALVEHAPAETTVHHFMDIVSVYLRGEAENITIRQAWRVEPQGEQHTTGTQVGDTTLEADCDVMVRCIEERKRIQAEQGGKNQRTKSLKITANSCYGISAERLVNEEHEPGHPNHERFDCAGLFYNPHVASTITAGGRLMLTLGEVVAERNGGNLHYCDTDSLVVDSDVSSEVQAAFSDLNPYEKEPVASAEVLEIEHGKDGRKLDGVSLFALGVKKYAILDGRELVKFTEHGLGAFEVFRSDGAVQKFWVTLLRRYYNIQVDGAGFDPTEVTRPLVWQQTASTELVRGTVQKYLSDTFRFGDWVERVIDTDTDGTKTVYIGIDVTSKALRLRQDSDGDTVDVAVLEGQELLQEELKRVVDLLNEWHQNQQIRTRRYGRRPAVTVAGTQVVTKESATEEMALNATVDSLIHLADSIGQVFG